MATTVGGPHVITHHLWQAIQHNTPSHEHVQAFVQAVMHARQCLLRTTSTKHHLCLFPWNRGHSFRVQGFSRMSHTDTLSRTRGPEQGNACTRKTRTRKSMSWWHSLWVNTCSSALQLPPAPSLMSLSTQTVPDTCAVHTAGKGDGALVAQAAVVHLERENRLVAADSLGKDLGPFWPKLPPWG